MALPDSLILKAYISEKAVIRLGYLSTAIIASKSFAVIA